MAVDMKTMIAEAAVKLLTEKNRKKITVRDIVEECSITRQAFYYHFEDIPDLMSWAVSQRLEALRVTLEGMEGGEAQLRYLFVIALNARKDIAKGINSNYGKELEAIIYRQLYAMFDRVLEEGDGAALPKGKRQLVARYHCAAILGILAAWRDEDTMYLDEIVHDIYLLLTGEEKQLYKQQ